jgi:protein-S-isoprenylcysteine O-methyltransferase Ste14
MIRRLIVQTLAWTVGVGVLLFASAGTLRWPGAWIYLGLSVALGLAGGLWLARRDPALLKERLGGIVRRDQVPEDRILIVGFLALMAVWFVFMGVDVRFHWSRVPAWVQVIGVLAMLLSLWVGMLAMRANSFAVPVVRVQRERGHAVVTTGLYGFVRHPLYSSAIMFNVAMPLLLGSWWGLVFVPAFVVLLGRRALIEERLLTAELQGYQDYAARVRYRLLPLLW